MIALPGKEGELLKQLVEQRGDGVTLGISGPILHPTNKFDNMASYSSLGPTYDAGESSPTWWPLVTASTLRLL